MPAANASQQNLIAVVIYPVWEEEAEEKEEGHVWAGICCERAPTAAPYYTTSCLHYGCRIIACHHLRYRLRQTVTSDTYPRSVALELQPSWDEHGAAANMVVSCLAAVWLQTLFIAGFGLILAPSHGDPGARAELLNLAVEATGVLYSQDCKSPVNRLKIKAMCRAWHNSGTPLHISAKVTLAPQGSHPLTVILAYCELEKLMHAIPSLTSP